MHERTAKYVMSRARSALSVRWDTLGTEPPAISASMRLRTAVSVKNRPRSALNAGMVTHLRLIANAQNARNRWSDVRYVLQPLVHVIAVNILM